MLLLGTGAGLLLLGTLLFSGGKKKEGGSSVVEEADPDLAVAALAAEPGEVVVRDEETGAIDLVTVPEASPEDDPELAVAQEEAAPGEVAVRNPDTGEIGFVAEEDLAVAVAEEEAETSGEILPDEEAEEAEDPELDEAAQEAEPGEVAVRDAESGEIGFIAEKDLDKVEEEMPEMVIPSRPPEDALALLKQLLAAERLANWRDHHKANITQWQAARGLVADGLAGPKTILLLAEETSVAPIVRYWPRGTWRGSPAQADFVSQLQALGVDSSREKGQGFAPVQRITDFAEIVE